MHIEDTRYNFVSHESDIYIYIYEYIRFNNKIISEFNSVVVDNADAVFVS